METDALVMEALYLQFIRDTRKRNAQYTVRVANFGSTWNYCSIVNPFFSCMRTWKAGRRAGKIMFCNTVRNFVLTAKFALLLLGTSIRLVLMAAYIRGRRRHSTCSSQGLIRNLGTPKARLAL